MTFQQAKEKLKEIASGRYHSVEYKLTQYSENTGGDMFPECTVYIDGMEHYKGTTWEEAFTALDRKTNGIEIDPEEAPDAVATIDDAVADIREIRGMDEAAGGVPWERES